MIRVLLVDDDALVRGALTMILSRSEGIEVVGEASDGDEAVPAVQAHHPDVVLMDLRMGRVQGVEATAALQRLAQPPAVLVLTSFDADADVLAALEAGARGFLLKDSAPQEIAAAVRSVAEGDAVLSPRVARYVVSMVATNPHTQDRRDALARLAVLTEREQEIATHVARGLSNADIGRELYLSEGTVKTHVSHAMAKLGIESRVLLALLVQRAGIGVSA
ncbi:response regulator [Cellulomonas hominis]